MAEHYQRPGWFTRHVFNPLVALLTRLGISVAGSRVLEVRGRKTGAWRPTPVNLLRFEGSRYLVAGMAYLVRRLLENTANESFLYEQARGAPLEELLAAP